MPSNGMPPHTFQAVRRVHRGAPNSLLLHIIVRSGESVQELPKQPQAFQVSIGATIKIAPRSLLTYPVPISARKLIVLRFGRGREREESESRRK